jgi:ubiquinone biosynthesis accessory factor UbiK
MPASGSSCIKDLRHGGIGKCTALARPHHVGALSGCEAAVLEQTMTFMNSNALDDLARRLAEALPPSLRSFGRDLESNFKAVLQAQLAKLDLVNRTEFDVQAALLARTQAALAAMEQRLKDLEAKLTP